MRTVGFTIVLLGLAVAGWLLFGPAPTKTAALTPVSEAAPPAAQQPAEAPPDARPEADETQTAGKAAEPGVTVAPTSSSRPSPRASAHQEPQVVVPENLELKGFGDAGRAMAFADYADVVADEDAITGESAFLAYEYVRSCIGAPVTEQAFETRLEQYTTAFERRGRPLDRRYERIMDRTQQLYLRCEGLGDDDLVQLAAEWLQLSADLDYLPAQVSFYRELPTLLNEERGRLFKEPVYLEIHREKSADYLERALRTGHPQAFRAMAQALEDGVIYQKDRLAALAYMMAADLAAAGKVADIQSFIGTLEVGTTAADRSLARGWARTLCRQHCRWRNEDVIPRR